MVAASNRTRKPRPAQPGDVCVLLLPEPDAVDRIRLMQASLQSVFGGIPHETVHLTCQRFEMAHDDSLPGIIQHLEATLANVPPILVVAASLVQVEHAFWQSLLLRWCIEATDDLRCLTAAIEDGLAAAGITPHFPRSSGWIPAHVTALEALTPGRDLDHRLRNDLFPHPLFTGRRIVLSRILRRGEFDLLWMMQIGSSGTTFGRTLGLHPAS